jgi:hypothetical protein
MSVVGPAAVVARELATTDYGVDDWADRGDAVLDPQGHNWHFAQRLRGPRGPNSRFDCRCGCCLPMS